MYNWKHFISVNIKQKIYNIYHIFSAHEQTSPLSDQIGRNEYETDLTDSKLEYNKADENYSDDEVKESFLENKENINAKVYVEQVDTIGETQSIIRQHEAKYTLKYIQYRGSKDFANSGT